MAQIVVYQQFGFRAKVSYAVVWATQIIVVMARALAAAEFCRRVLGRYPGVWALAVRVLVGCGLAALLSVLYFGQDGLKYAVVTLEIAAEAFIATLVVGTFTFVRYYQAQLDAGPLMLGLGLGFNSCLKILNDAVLARYLRDYAGVWNEIGMVAFCGVLVTWIFAMRVEASSVEREIVLHPAPAYNALVPQMNERLRELNQHLIQLWRLEQPKP